MVKTHAQLAPHFPRSVARGQQDKDVLLALRQFVKPALKILARGNNVGRIETHRSLSCFRQNAKMARQVKPFRRIDGRASVGAGMAIIKLCCRSRPTALPVSDRIGCAARQGEDKPPGVSAVLQRFPVPTPQHGKCFGNPLFPVIRAVGVSPQLANVDENARVKRLKMLTTNCWEKVLTKKCAQMYCKPAQSDQFHQID